MIGSNTQKTKETIQFELSPLKKKDISSLVELEKKLFPIDQWSEEIFVDELERDPHSIKVVRINRKVIGYVHTEFADRKLRNGRIVRIGEIGSVAVDEKFRGQKLGEKLVRHGIRRLQRKDADKIILHTRLDNNAMQRLASEKFGFQTTKIKKNAYDDGASAYEMVLELK